VVLAVEVESAAEQIGGSLKLLLPKPVTHQDYRDIAWSFFFWKKGPTSSGSNAQRLEKPWSRSQSFDLFWITVASKIKGLWKKGTHVLEDMILLAPFHKLCGRGSETAFREDYLPDHE
jgi:hypothetical protein